MSRRVLADRASAALLGGGGHAFSHGIEGRASVAQGTRIRRDAEHGVLGGFRR
jgi:hypothetical protein